MIRVASLFTAGTNCDEETMFAFDRSGAKAERVHLNLLKKNRRLLEKYQILALPGGFTYGDYISAGKILANELQYILADSITEFMKNGKLIIGICNGFQVLVKAGILPGFTRKQSVTLNINDSNRFECRWVYLKANPKSPCVFTKDIDMMPVPTAHAEGKFVVDSDATLAKIKKNNQDVFTYINPQGGKARYPDNPNGSIQDIAGICDPTGRIFGLMPHPERAASIYQYPDWFIPAAKRRGESKLMQEPIGLKVFKNAVKYAQENL